jgi:hypothetical protein
MMITVMLLIRVVLIEMVKMTTVLLVTMTMVVSLPQPSLSGTMNDDNGRCDSMVVMMVMMIMMVTMVVVLIIITLSGGELEINPHVLFPVFRYIQ